LCCCIVPFSWVIYIANCLSTSLRNLRHFRYPRSCLRSNNTQVPGLGHVTSYFHSTLFH
jgi:hypothetical protein